MKTISRYIMTLALLLTAVTGAWAQTTVTWTEADLTGSGSDLTTYTKDGVTIKCSDRISSGKSFNGPVTISTTLGNFTKIEITGQGSAPIQSDIFTNDGNVSTWTGNAASLNFPNAIAYATQFVFTIEPAEAPLTVDWTAATKTGTFAMPAFDVVLTPIYAKAAAFATTGTEPEVKTLLPAAAEGIIAGTDASLIAEGTGIVALAGTSTEVTQGTLMYAIGTSATEAPALTAFSATVPTAKDVADDGATLYVWYYIKGADAPDGVAATLDNTFSDTEPACLTVQVLTNKFDIQLNAANANTIEAGKATVTVGDEAAEVKEGKLTGVKMGSEVKLEAKPGYKFRKVEVKKKGDGPLAAAFKDGAKIKVGYKWNTYNTTYLEFTNSGGTYSLTSVSGNNDGNGFNSSTLTVKDSNVLALDVVCNPGGRSKEDDFSAQIEFDATSSTYKYSSKGGYFTGIISVSVNDTDITLQLSEAK